jgi:putative oxidoreductase
LELKVAAKNPLSSIHDLLTARLFAWTDRVQGIAPLLARLSLGYVFIDSGWGKFHNLEKVVEYFTSIGIPFASSQAPFVAGVELACGLLIFVGLFTRLASLPLMGTMVVAILTAKRADIHDLGDLLMLIDSIYIVILLWLVMYGPGALSLDAWIAKPKPVPRIGI